MVDEGRSINISCNSTGSPTPTIVWEMDGEPFLYPPTEISVEPQVPERGFLQDVMLGNINSTVQVINASYPDDEGYYTCVGTNDEEYSNFTIYVQVLGTLS